MQASAAPGPSPSPSDGLSRLRPGLLTRFNHCRHDTENPSHRITYTRANVYLPNNLIGKNDYYPPLEKRKQTQKSWATNMSQSQHLKSSLPGANLRSLHWMELPFGPQLTIWIYGSWDSFSFAHLFNTLFICFIEVCLIYKKLHTSRWVWTYGYTCDTLTMTKVLTCSSPPKMSLCSFAHFGFALVRTLNMRSLL